MGFSDTLAIFARGLLRMCRQYFASLCALSSKARALISLPDFFPTRDTLSVIEGDRIFRIVSPGTGSESSVSNKENRLAVTVE